MPLKGVSSYSADGGELYNPELDAAYWESLQKELPETIEIESMDVTAQEPPPSSSAPSPTSSTSSKNKPPRLVLFLTYKDEECFKTSHKKALPWR